MTTSGAYTFSTSAASGLTLVAFSRIGIRRTEITPQHLQDAAVEANLLQVTLANNQPNLWKSEVYDITLVAGTANYALPARMIAVQDIYLSTDTNGVSVDRMLGPMSLYDYDSQANKTQQAPPTAYVIYKVIPTPSITFWQVPDGNATYTAHVRFLGQSQDVSQANGTSLDMPYIYLDVYVAGLAHRLSRIYARDQEMIRKQDYLDAWQIAAQTDTQDSVTMTLQPDWTGYYQ